MSEQEEKLDKSITIRTNDRRKLILKDDIQRLNDNLKNRRLKKTNVSDFANDIFDDLHRKNEQGIEIEWPPELAVKRRGSK